MGMGRPFLFQGQMLTVEAENTSAIATSSQMAAAPDYSPTETLILPNPDSPTLLLSFQAAAAWPPSNPSYSAYVSVIFSLFIYFALVALLRPIPRLSSLQQNMSQGNQNSTSSGSRRYQVCGSMTSQRHFDDVGSKTYLNESSSSYKTVSRI